MAIARGAGTETLRSIFLETVDSTVSSLIFGVQHHIYTVLSIIVQVQAVQAQGNKLYIYLNGYDSKAGTTGRYFNILEHGMHVGETFVFNDKFSFNGAEPTNFTGPMDDATKQDAIADQGQNTAQILRIKTEHADDNVDVICTFIDQNNA